LAGEVIVVGVRDHIEVWSAEKWDRYVAQHDGQYEQLAEAAFVGSVHVARDSAESDGEATALGQTEAGSRVLPR
jgi:hypothetical protein